MNTNITTNLCDNLNVRINVLRERSLNSCQVHRAFKVRPRFRAPSLFLCQHLLIEQSFVDTKFEKHLYFIHLKCKDDIYYLDMYIWPCGSAYVIKRILLSCNSSEVGNRSFDLVFLQNLTAPCSSTSVSNTLERILILTCSTVMNCYCIFQFWNFLL